MHRKYWQKVHTRVLVLEHVVFIIANVCIKKQTSTVLFLGDSVPASCPVSHVYYLGASSIVHCIQQVCFLEVLKKVDFFGFNISMFSLQSRMFAFRNKKATCCSRWSCANFLSYILRVWTLWIQKQTHRHLFYRYLTVLQGFQIKTYIVDVYFTIHDFLRWDGDNGVVFVLNRNSVLISHLKQCFP